MSTNERLPGETMEEEQRLTALEAERGLLSCVLQDPLDCLMKVHEQLPGVEAFSIEPHRVIWETALEMHDAGKPVGDPIAMTQVLIDLARLDRIGGPGLITDLYTFVTVTGHFEYYLGVVKEKWLLRQLRDLGRETVRAAVEAGRDDLDTSASEVIGEAERKTFDLLQAAQRRDGGVDNQIVDNRTMNRLWSQKLKKTIARRGQVFGIQTGLVDVDRQFGGLATEGEGDFLLCGGFPGMGKTTMGVTHLENIAIQQGEPTLVFPLEMGRDGWSDRLNLGRCGADTRGARNGFISTATLDRLPKVLTGTDESPIFWDPSATITTAELRAKVQTMVRQHGIRCVIIDHFGQLKPSTPQGKSDKVLGQIEILETIHKLRRELRILIILFAQLDKAARETQKKNQPPSNGDLKGASELVEYPTHIKFLHRPNEVRPWQTLTEEQQERWIDMTEPYRKACPEAWATKEDLKRAEWKTVHQIDYEEHAIIRITKNRNGPTDDGICVRYRAEIQRIENRTTKLYSNSDAFRQVRLPGF